MSERGMGRVAGVAALCLAALAAETASADKARWRMGPFVDADVTDTGHSLVAGIEAYPSTVSAIGGRLSIMAYKADPDVPRLELGSERYNFGVRLQVLSEFGRGARPAGAALRGPDLSLFGVGADAQWTLSRYDFRPGGRLPESTLESSWAVGVRSWWFTALGTPQPVRGGGKGKLVSGEREPPEPIEYRAWLAQPQIVSRYGRYVAEAPDSIVVTGRRSIGFADASRGLLLAETMKLTPPTLYPTASLIFAMPMSPPSGRFAFGPAVRVTAWGAAGEWDPFSQAVRGRMETWLYYFAFQEGTAVRVGVAPYVDVLLAGTDHSDDIVGGAVLELRTSASRLEY